MKLKNVPKTDIFRDVTHKKKTFKPEKNLIHKPKNETYSAKKIICHFPVFDPP